MTAEPTLNLVEQPLPVDQKALSYSEIVKALPPIKTADEYVRIGDLWKEGRALLKEIDEGYDDLIKAAHKLHKDAVAKKAKYYTPVDGAVRAAKSLMEKFDQQQEAIRQAEQRRLEEIARKEEAERRRVELERLEVERKAEEDRLLLAAIAASKAGDEARMEEMLNAAQASTETAKQEAAAIQAEPVYVAPVVLAKETPRVQGLSFRTIWKWKIKDLNAVPRQYMVPDEVKIGQVVRALKTQHGISGITAYEERC